MNDEVTSGSAWGGVPPVAPDQPRQRAVDSRSPMDRRALEEAMILSGQRGNDNQRAVRVGELEEYFGGVFGTFVQQFEAPIKELNGLISDPALLFRNAGLSAPEIVEVLPETGNFPGRLAFLTGENKLYRWTGTEWTAEVAAVDIKDGSITGDKIAGNTITGNKIVANTITGGLLATSGIITQTAQIGDSLITLAKIDTASINNLSAINANMGTITAGEMKSADGKFKIDLNAKTITITV